MGCHSFSRMSCGVRFYRSEADARARKNRIGEEYHGRGESWAEVSG